MSREHQDLLSRSALGVFRLNGQFLSVAEELARPAGLTAAWWQVLGAVLPEPLPVSPVSRFRPAWKRTRNRSTTA